MTEKPHHRKDTLVVTAGREPDANFGYVNPPVFHGSTILHPTVKILKTKGQPYTYGRRGSPTISALQKAITALEGGHNTVLTPSGLSAVSTALIAHLKAGDHLLMVDSAYGPTRDFCDKLLTRMGVDVEYYDPRIGAGIARQIKSNTAVVFAESPGSNSFEIQDLPAIAAVAHDRDVVVIADNTYGAGFYCRPLALGADISVQAVTKYLCGHSDVLMGSITTNERTWGDTLFRHGALGQTVAPDDVYLVLRGIRTLGVRLERHMATSLVLARWLEARPEVACVIHPALDSHPDHAIWQRDFSGACGLFSFVFKPEITDNAIAAMLDGMELMGMGFSWGGFESLMIPQDLSHNRTVTSGDFGGQLLRIHAGLEDVADLLADLDAGFVRLNAASV
ncbi:MAG: cystathionine beta-lyase [Parvibaculaceae bacterium]